MPEEPDSPNDDGTLTVLHAMLTTFSDVLDAMDRRLGSMEAALHALRSDKDRAEELREALHNLGRVELIENDLREMRATLQSLVSEHDRSDQLREALHNLGRVEGIEGDLAEIRTSLHALQSERDQTDQLREALHNLGRVEGIENDLSAMRAALMDHPASTIYDAVVRMSGQVDALVAQPGPGPAMAMVAAGLSERFEQRTENLVVLLQEHAELMHALTEHVQQAMQGLVVTVEGRQAGLDALLDTVRAVASTIQGMGARLEEARDRLDAVLRAGGDLPAAVASLRELEEAIRETAETIQHGSVAGLAGVVREESELLSRRLAAISVSVDAVGRLLSAHSQETSHSLGRKASEAGRRLASDLGLTPRSKERPRKPPPRPAPKPPRPSDP
ncbi:MAG TPA: hypothetical protein VNA57_13655 [Acidimicrobiales bacterium]|nr:hypothetical protein [Acidimicrobiales bacterium]